MWRFCGSFHSGVIRHSKHEVPLSAFFCNALPPQLSALKLLKGPLRPRSHSTIINMRLQQCVYMRVLSWSRVLWKRMVEGDNKLRSGGFGSRLRCDMNTSAVGYWYLSPRCMKQQEVGCIFFQWIRPSVDPGPRWAFKHSVYVWQ